MRSVSACVSMLMSPEGANESGAPIATRKRAPFNRSISIGMTGAPYFSASRAAAGAVIASFPKKGEGMPPLVNF